MWRVVLKYCRVKKRAKLLASSSIKVCLACLLSKMTCAWTMFWLLGLSTIMLSWCTGLIEVLHHRSEGIFFFSNWSYAFILGIKHRQHILLNFSIFIFYYIIFIILSSLCSFSWIRWISLSLVLLLQTNNEKSSHSYNQKPSLMCNYLTLDVKLISFWSLNAQNS